MCGLAGIIERQGRPCGGALRRMARAIEHRGPDSEGVFAAGRVGLAHRRLSILDLSDRASQPMQSDDGTLVVVYNGEIYNYQSLRDRLRDARPLRTSGDTEVLLRAFEEGGTECLRGLNGMFAFAMLDQRAGEVILARDPWGIKPLYYAFDGNRFYFASEVKAIFAAGFTAVPDQMAVLDHVFTAWTCDDRTLFKGIRRLPAGSLLRYDLRSSTFKIERFFTASPDWSRAEELGESRERWIDAIDSGLTAAVKSQLVSDVPVGTFCSGGLDSSLVTALAAKLHPDLHAYNVTCPDCPEVDEGPYAQRLSSELGVNLRRLVLTRENFRHAVVQNVYWQEMPLMVINAVAMQLVSAMAQRDGVKVLLTGEGADEIFGGYMDLYRRNALARVIRAHGRFMGACISRAVRTVETLGKRLGMFSPGEPGTTAHELLTRSTRVSSTRIDAAAFYERLRDPLDRALAAELHGQLHTYLPPLLHRADRASMGASIELRVPFLDLQLASLALAAPPRFKVGVSGLRPYGKRILKEVAVRHIPADLAYRPKMGFSVPPSYYLGPWPRSWLKDGFVADEFGLRKTDLERWVGAQTDQSACWMLTLEMWGQMFVRGRSVDEVSEDYLGMGESRSVSCPRRAEAVPLARSAPGVHAIAGGRRLSESSVETKGSSSKRGREHLGGPGVAGAGEAGSAGRGPAGIAAEHGAAAEAVAGEGLVVEFGVAAVSWNDRLLDVFTNSAVGAAVAEVAMMAAAVIV